MRHRLSLFLILAVMGLSACVPNPNLTRSSKAPPVTGDFDEVFAPGSAKMEAFRQPTVEEQLKAQVDAREKASIQAKFQAQNAKVNATVSAKPAVNYLGDMKVAVLLPLSGETAEIANDLLDAAMLAIYDSKNANGSGYSVTLLPKNTAASPSVAAALAKQAIAEGAKIIVGPLYSQEVETVKQVSGDIPIITFSNNNEIKGEKCFVFGLTPETEVARVTEYAMKQGRLKFGAIIPNDEYGMKLAKALKSNITAKGGQVDEIEHYIDSTDGRKTAAKRLAERMRISPIEALFIAATPENTQMLMNELRGLGVDVAALMLLGTSQWAMTDLSKLPNELKHGIFSGTNDRTYQRFAERFNAVMKRTPKRISTYAYDAVAQIAEMAKEGKIPTAEELVAAEIIQGRAVGTYRYEADGKVARSIAIYQYTDKGLEIIETPPKEF